MISITDIRGFVSRLFIIAMHGSNFRNRHVNGHVILQLGLMVGKPLRGRMISMQYWIIDSAAIISKDMDELACV